MKKLLALIALVAVGIGFSLDFGPQPVGAAGGVPDSFKSFVASSTIATGTSTPIVASGSGIIHSIVVASSSANTTKTFQIYDATSTQATSSARLKAQFGQTGVSNGTYLLDSEFYSGLKIDVPNGFNGSFVITYRVN